MIVAAVAVYAVYAPVLVGGTIYRSMTRRVHW